uniref:Carbohydrate sulfotransferase 1-like n=2 Tax=Hirondellea gigas TaxID=1518452 RepID=A0A6A7FYK5_9CRUS
MYRRAVRRSMGGWRGLVAGLLLGATLVLTSLSLIYTRSADLLLLTKEAAAGGPPLQRTADQYTLPSLDDVLQGSSDLDFNRVLKHYRTQHQQVPANTPIVHIILASTWRSGSTLLGELLAAHPGVYYHYEPLMSYGVRQLTDNDADAVNSLLSDLFKCDYRHQEEYLRFAFVNSDVFARNSRLWSMCTALPRSKCYAPDILAKICALFPIHLAKLVRVRLSLLERQLKDPRIKIVWLVRDPRAVMNSRLSNVDWCKTSSCNDPATMCSSLYDDYITFLSFRDEFPNKVMLMRYEDLAKDAYNKSRNVLEFAGLSLHPDVMTYLDGHLSTNVDVPWSTKHEPKATMSRWLKTMNWSEVLRVQQSCSHYMRALGYRIFETPTDMISGNAVGLLNLPK